MGFEKQLKYTIQYVYLNVFWGNPVLEEVEAAVSCFSFYVLVP